MGLTRARSYAVMEAHTSDCLSSSKAQESRDLTRREAVFSVRLFEGSSLLVCYRTQKLNKRLVNCTFYSFPIPICENILRQHRLRSTRHTS